MKKTLYQMPLLWLCLFFLPTISLTAQSSWFNDATLQDAERLGGTRLIQPSEARIVGVDLEALKTQLLTAPMWHTPEARTNAITLQIPMPDGHDRVFKVVEAPVMDEALSARFPGMRSYAGYSPEDGTAYARFGFTHKGFHAMILSGLHSTVFIDVYSDGQTRYHQVYYKSDYTGIIGNHFSCRLDHAHGEEDTAPSVAPQALIGDCLLRDYRLAIACTGEYAQFHGGTIPDVLSAYNVAMTRVNGVYERDFTVHMELIDETDQVIYLNAGTDPYTNNNSGALLGENQATIDNIIGSDNYDIGHVFSTGGGGVASLASVCTNRKARGVTGLPSPINDPFYIDYVAHEIGHQFGANHTQNNSCNRVGATAMEPGSASTIMGYAGICAPNVQNNSDDHFHAISIQEITNNIEFGSGGTCPELINVDNSGPEVTSVGTTLVLPVSTPFFLTADATDADGDSLTYCWEQMDNEVATMPPVSASTGGPAFRSLSPSPSPTRYFPNLPSVVSGTPVTWEVLPSVSRSMNFRCSVRDNVPGGGCVTAADVELTFSDDAGPFVVQQPNTSLVWNVGAIETILWDVAGTDAAPVNCPEVDIYLSTDGGFSYPILLAENVPNDGSHDVVVPFEESTTARIQVVGSGNIFYDISDENFEIQLPPNPTFFIAASPSAQTLCNDTAAVFEIILAAVSGFDETLDLSVSGLPNGATATFSANPVGPDETVSLTIDNLADAASGVYNLTVEANSPSLNKTVDLSLDIAAGVPDAPILSLPASGQQTVPVNATLSWNTSDFTDFYELEVATSPAFGAATIVTETLSDTTFALSGLDEGTVYYWRVIPVNECGAGTDLSLSSFQTLSSDCIQYVDNDPGLEIPPSGTGEFPTTLLIEDNFLIDNITVGIVLDHTWVGDLSATLTAPDGTTILLFDQPGVPGSDFGCSQDNINVEFDDDAALTAADFENTCGAGGGLAISGVYQSLELLSTLQGSESAGEWTLTISDAFNQDGGNLISWWIEICPPVDAPAPADTLANLALTVNYAQSELISSAFLAYEKAGVTAGEITYRVMALPEHGMLSLDGTGALQLGSVFTQADIDAALLSYQHDASFTSDDQFVFDLTDAAGGWRSNEVFEIVITDPSVLSALASVTSGISCSGFSDGTIEVTVSGGLPPYAYALNEDVPQDSPVFSNLSAGDYAIVVTDGSGQEITLPIVTVNEPDVLVLGASTSVNTLVLQASGGTSPYQYSIDGGQNFGTTSTFNGLSNGDYALEVVDANGCTESTSFTLNLLQTAEASVSNSSCADEQNGSITVGSVQGGEAPYTYALNGGDSQSSAEFTGLGAGTYTVLIIDNNGSELLLNNILVEAPDALQLAAAIVGNTLSIQADGGTAPYQYSIDGGGTFGTDNEFSDLPNGTYNIQVVDANGCLVTGSAIVNQIVSADVTAAATSCSNTLDGSILVNSIEGGASPYTYQLGEGNPQNNPLFNGLPAGTYSLTITDANGNVFEVSDLTILSPPPLNLMTDVNGTDLTLMVSGGIAPYTYSIDGGNSFSSDSTFTGLNNGNYSIFVLDANDCVVAGQATINVIVGATSVVSNVSCSGNSDGQIAVEGLEGGQSPYTYSLDGGDAQNDPLFSGLQGGTYSILITDANGSTLLLENIIVDEPLLLELNPTLLGANLTLSGAGGTPPYNYSIDGGSTFSDSGEFGTLDNGTYDLVLVDANDCVVNGVITINVIIGIDLTVGDVSCSGEEDGSFEVTGVTGGVAPYLYQINDGGFVDNPLFTGLASGTYQLDIQDSNGFVFSSTIEVTAPALLEAGVLVVEDSIDVSAAGGTPPYTYSIDGGLTFSSTSTFGDLPNGEYGVLVMDANGCTTDLVTVTVMVSNLERFPDSWAVTISPNPTSGPLHLTGTGFEATELQWSLVNPLGQILRSGEVPVSGGQWELPLSLAAFPAGTYWIQLQTQESRGTWPVVKH